MLPGQIAAQSAPDPDLDAVRSALREAEQAEIVGDYRRAWDIVLTANDITSRWGRGDLIEHWQVYEAFAGVYNAFEDYRQAKLNATYALTGLTERFEGDPRAATLALSARWELMLAHFRTDECDAVLRLAEPLAATPAASPVHLRAAGLAAVCLGRTGAPRAAAALAAALALPGIDKALGAADGGQVRAQALRVMTQAGGDAAARAAAAQALAALARTPGLAPHLTVDFLQVAGLAVLPEDPETAAVLFREAGRLLRPTETDAALYLANERHLATVAALTGDGAGAMARLDAAVTLFAQTAPALQPDVALTEYALGELRRRAGDRTGAQSLFRSAYLRARTTLPVDAGTVLTIRRAIDIRDPGFATFALAPELSTVALVRGPVTDMSRPQPGSESGGEDLSVGAVEALLSRFLAGRYADMPGPAGVPEGPQGAALAALGHALLGEQREALDLLAMADPASGPPWLTDLTLAVALQWGTLDRIEEGHAATLRLIEQAMSLPDDVGTAVLGLEVFYRYVIEDDDDQRRAIGAWRNGWDPERPKTAWDAFAAMLVMEAAYDVMPQAEADALQATVLDGLSMRRDLGFARDFIAFVRHYNGITARVDEGALIELGTLVPRLQAAVPTGHAITASTNFSYANALWAQGREAEAVALYRTALSAYERNAYGLRDDLLFLRAELANALYVTGAADEAMLLSQSALGPLATERDAMRPSRVMRIVSRHAFIVADRTSTRAAAEVMRPFAEDAGFLSRLHPVDAFFLRTEFALYLAGSGDAAGAGKAMAQADAALAREAAPDDDLMAQVFYQRALVQGWLGEDAAAYGFMAEAMDRLEAARAAEVLLRQTGVALVRPQDRVFAMTFAAYAYGYARRLR